MAMISPHQHIVKMIEGSKGVLKKIDGRVLDVIYIVTEYCQGGDLMDFIMHLGTIPESIARVCFLQILSAVQHLHIASQTISHRDLKPQNLLVDENFNLKLCDFGLAEVGYISISTQGTTGFKAPEVE